MTNSAKQTKTGKGSAAEPSTNVPAYATGDFWSNAINKHPAMLMGLFLLVAGCGFILHNNNWHLTVPVFMLWLGWAGVIATARFLWWAGIAMASDTGSDGDALDMSASRLRELQDEKKILVRAIKEIEFDRDLGKMSEEDAKDVMRFYRARAIEVIKEIDGQSDAELTVPQRIERDLQARLAVQTQPLKGGRETPAQKAARIKTARANAKVAADAKAAAEASEEKPSEKKASEKEATETKSKQTPASSEDDETEAAESA